MRGLAERDQGDQGFVAADFGGQRPVAGGLPGLTAQRFGLRPDLGHHVVETEEVFLRALEAQFGLVAAGMQAADAGGFFEDAAAGLRLGGDDLADLALPHHGRRARARRGVGEQQLHVAGAHLAAVDAIGRALFALDAAGDFENVGIVEDGGRGAGAVVEHQRDFGMVARRARAGAGEDDVVHAGGAHLLVGILAHDPAQGLDEIGLAAAVRPHDAGKAGADHEIGRLHETFEAGQSQLVEFHVFTLFLAGHGRRPSHQLGVTFGRSAPFPDWNKAPEARLNQAQPPRKLGKSRLPPHSSTGLGGVQRSTGLRAAWVSSSLLRGA